MNENEIPENLKSAMAEYATQSQLMKGDDAIIDLYNVRDELAKQLADVEKVIETQTSKYRIKELEEYITSQVMEYGESVVHAGVKAKHVSGYVKTTWQGKVIDKILFDNPSLIPIFKPAKKETDVKPRVTVEYVGEGASLAYTREDYEASKAESVDDLPI